MASLYYANQQAESEQIKEALDISSRRPPSTKPIGDNSATLNPSIPQSHTLKSRSDYSVASSSVAPFSVVDGGGVDGPVDGEEGLTFTSGLTDECGTNSFTNRYMRPASGTQLSSYRQPGHAFTNEHAPTIPESPHASAGTSSSFPPSYPSYPSPTFQPSQAAVSTATNDESKSKAQRNSRRFIALMLLGIAIFGIAAVGLGVGLGKYGNIRQNSDYNDGTEAREGPSTPANQNDTIENTPPTISPSPSFGIGDDTSTTSPSVATLAPIIPPTLAPNPTMDPTEVSLPPLSTNLPTQTTPNPTSPPLLNDECTGAIITNLGGQYEGSTTSASSDLEGLSGCLLQEDDGPGVWYLIVGTGVSITASTCNPLTNFDTKINVFSSSDTTSPCEDESALVCEAVNDDASDNSCGTQSRVTWFGESGMTYYLLLTGYAGSTGSYELSFQSVPIANDACEDAIVLSNSLLTQTYTGFTSFAAFDTIDDCASNDTSVLTTGVWYRLGIPPSTGATWTFSTCTGASFDTLLSVYTGDDCNNLSCVANNDDGCGTDNTGSRLALTPTNNGATTTTTTTTTTYYIFVHGFLGATGDFTLQVAPTFNSRS